MAVHTCCLVPNVTQCRGCQTLATVLHSPLFGILYTVARYCTDSHMVRTYFEHAQGDNIRTAAAGDGTRSLPCSKHLLHPMWHCSKPLPHQLPCHRHHTHHMHPTCPGGSTDLPCPVNCPPHSMCCCCQVGQMDSSAEVHPQCHYCSWLEPAEGQQKKPCGMFFL